MSLIKELKEKGKIDEEFVIKMNSLTMEEIIGIKFESAARMVRGKIYGHKMLNIMHAIVEQAIIRYTREYIKYPVDAAYALGIDRFTYKKLIKKYIDKETQWPNKTQHQ
tara:strand:+ start:659 stop:985 length:327 start_codon:yes stop_codon:yes gene_type:complete